MHHKAHASSRTLPLSNPHTLSKAHPSSTRSAFTIVELLIVIVVIAILATISIIAYRGIQDRANASSAQSLASQTATKLKLYYAEHESYPTTLTDAGITSTTGLQYTYNNTATPKTFCITATTANKSYYQNTTTSTTPTEGGCAGHGVGGGEAVTNMADHPNFIGTGSIASGWAAFSQGTANAITRSVSGNVQTLTATALSGGNRRVGISDSVDIGTGLPNTRYLTARLTVNTTGIAPGTTLRFYFDCWNGADYSSHTQSFSAFTSSSSATQLIIPPTLLAGSPTRVEPFIWIESGSDWTGSSTIKASQLAIYVTNAATSITQYYDGSSPNWVWNGTPDNSTSTGPAL